MIAQIYEFKIIEDITLSYGDSDKLYVMLIKINTQFYFEIDSNQMCLCRRKLINRQTAETAVASISFSLCNCEDLSSAKHVLSQALKMKTLKEFLFLLKINYEMKYEEIFILQKRFGYKTSPISGFDENIGFIEIHEEIAITFPNEDSPLGYYRPICEDSDTYKFHLSDFYSFKD